MSVRVILQENAFSAERREFECAPSTVAEIIRKLDPAKAVNTGWRILVNDEITRDFSKKTKNGDTVYIKLVPEGGDPKSSGAGMKVGGWFVAALGVIVSVTGWGIGLGVAMIGTGLGMALGGQCLLNLNIPNMDREKPKQDPSVRGSRNQPRPGGFIPILLGKRRIYADPAANPYTWVSDDGKIYLNQLFCCGQKDQAIDLSTVKIGDTLLTEFSASGSMDSIMGGSDELISMEVSYGSPSVPLGHRCVHEEAMNSVLKHETEDGQDASAVRTTPDGTTQINVDVFFYNGLGQYDDEGDIETAKVELSAMYKRADEPDSAYRRLGYFSRVDEEKDGELVTRDEASGSELKTKRYAITKSGLQPGSYTVKISRVTPDSTDSKVVDAVYVGSVRSVKDEQPVSPERCRQLCLVGLRVKASEKLGQVVDQLNFISQSTLPVYSGSGTGPSRWTQARDGAHATGNPASAAIYAMKGPLCQQVVDDDRINWTSFETLYTWCQEHRYECNEYITDSMQIQQLLSAIGSTCRCEIMRIDGKITAIQDAQPSAPVQLFTPRNSYDYTESMAMSDIPDALSVKFVDREAGYAENELSVFNTPDGNRAGPVETKQDLKLWGVTSSVQARMLAMYNYAVMKNRPIIHRFSCDIEYMMCRKGDWVKYAGDIALAGIAQGRIASLIKEGSSIRGFVPDEVLEMEYGKSYAVRMRLSDGSVILADIVTAPGANTEIYFEAPYGLSSGIEEGVLFAFGTVGNDTIDLLVTDIDCTEDLSASITCVELSPEIFDIDDPNFVLPDFMNKITDIPGLVDDGSVEKWTTFFTYHDGNAAPDRPTGDGTSGGWHRTRTPQSKWISVKTAPNVYGGAWSSPTPTGVFAYDELVGGFTIGDPTVPVIQSCMATRDGIEIDLLQNSNGIKNAIREYRVTLYKGADDTAGTTVTSPSGRLRYAFTRSVDGYPEAEDLEGWYIKAVSINVYGKMSAQAAVPVNTSEYGTWAPREISRGTFIPSRNEFDVKVFDAAHSVVDGVSIDRRYYGTTVYEYTFINGDGTTRGTASSTLRSESYTFNRAIDGYPEREDVALWTCTVRARCAESNRMSTVKSVMADASKYGTWIPQLPAVVTKREQGRIITISLDQPPRADRKELYGTAFYRIGVKRSEGNKMYVPAQSENPYQNELNYRKNGPDGGDNPEFRDITDFQDVNPDDVLTSHTYSQTMPLDGQNDSTRRVQEYFTSDDRADAFGDPIPQGARTHHEDMTSIASTSVAASFVMGDNSVEIDDPDSLEPTGKTEFGVVRGTSQSYITVGGYKAYLSEDDGAWFVHTAVVDGHLVAVNKTDNNDVSSTGFYYYVDNSPVEIDENDVTATEVEDYEVYGTTEEEGPGHTPAAVSTEVYGEVGEAGEYDAAAEFVRAGRNGTEILDVFYGYIELEDPDGNGYYVGVTDIRGTSGLFVLIGHTYKIEGGAVEVAGRTYTMADGDIVFAQAGDPGFVLIGHTSVLEPDYGDGVRAKSYNPNLVYYSDPECTQRAQVDEDTDFDLNVYYIKSKTVTVGENVYTVVSADQSATRHVKFSIDEGGHPKDTAYTFRVTPFTVDEETGGAKVVRISTPNYMDLETTAKATSALDIVNSAITENKLADGAVTVDKLAAGSVTADKIAVKDLYAISAVFGKIHNNEIEDESHNFWNLETGHFHVGNAMSIIDPNDQEAEYIDFNPDNGSLLIKLEKFVVKAITSIIYGLFLVKNKIGTIKNNLIAVNPESEAKTPDDEQGAIPALTAEINGDVNINGGSLGGTTRQGNLSVAGQISTNSLAVGSSAAISSAGAIAGTSLNLGNGTATAATFKGNLDGNAKTATKATSADSATTAGSADSADKVANKLKLKTSTVYSGASGDNNFDGSSEKTHTIYKPDQELNRSSSPSFNTVNCANETALPYGIYRTTFGTGHARIYSYYVPAGPTASQIKSVLRGICGTAGHFTDNGQTTNPLSRYETGTENGQDFVVLGTPAGNNYWYRGNETPGEFEFITSYFLG